MSGQTINQMKCRQCGYAHPAGTNCPPNSSLAATPGYPPYLMKGDRVCSERFGFGTVLSDPQDLTVPVVFDDDIAPHRDILTWTLVKADNEKGQR